MQARFWAEVYEGAKLFYLSGIQHGKYLKREILNLARFISVAKFRPLTWRLSHPYVIADRFEDITPPETLRVHPKCDRQVLLYGFTRGAALRQGGRVHLAGVGDFNVEVSLLWGFGGLCGVCDRFWGLEWCQRLTWM